MIIIGIDPGSRFTGYGIVESSRGIVSYRGSGCISTGGGPMADRLRIIYAGVSALIQQFHPESMSIEETFLSKNVQSTVKLSEARAAAMVAGANAGLKVHEYTPQQIKQAVVGTGAADKRQVMYRVRNVLALDHEPRPDHAADALAAAVCHANLTRTMNLGKARSFQQ